VWFFELSEPPELHRFGAGARYLPALLPVVTTKSKQPQLFTTVEEWREVARERGISFVQAAIAYEKASSGWTDGAIWAYFDRLADIMEGQIHSLERVGVENAADTPLLPIYGRHWARYSDAKEPLSDDLTRHIITHALSVNAKLPGVLVVPAPMGTGGGYMYSALDAVREKRGIAREKLVEALVVAAALGAIAYTHTNAAGHVGCVGESGICCAMASGAVTWLAGGDGVQVERAASMALQANLGIPCDPIAGGQEFPCITRTVRAAVTAPLYADMALAGLDPLIPYHELLQLIEQNYQTSDKSTLSGTRCGCNLTETGRRCGLAVAAAAVDELRFGM
jgi:L-serine dehydratase